MEEKIKDFKKRNDNQILLAKKIIGAYKMNENNLNYQIISNAKNILNFNDINPKNYKNDYSPINFRFNILKDFSIHNYANEIIKIEKIQKNIEIKVDSKEEIDCVLYLENKNKLIYNINNKIYLLNTKNYKIEDQIESKCCFYLMNLMEDKETILLSHENYIEKLSIEKDKLILELFLDDLYMKFPGIIINYEDQYAWTCRFGIGFVNNDYYRVEDMIENNIINSSSGGYDIYVFNIFKYKNDILFILKYFYYEECEDSDLFIKLGSYKKKSYFNEFLCLESYDINISDYHFDESKDFKIYNYNLDDIVIFGKLYIHIIDILNWTKKTKISISNRLIKDSYYLNNCCFLILFD